MKSPRSKSGAETADPARPLPAAGPETDGRDGEPAAANGRAGAQAAPSGSAREGFRGRPRTVLVLGGGGMRGMAHVGVLKAMQTLGLHYDAIVGTSIGALVGAMAAAGYSLERMESIVQQLKKGDYFKLNVVKFLLQGARTPSMYRGDLFRERLAEMLPPEGTFASLRLPFYCNAVRLETGGSVFWGSPGLDDVPLQDAVYSSCALPAIFEPYERDGFNYMDGGLIDPLPLRFAKTLRPDLIIAVDLTVKATFKTPNYKSRAVTTLFRAFEIAEEVVVEQMLHMHAGYDVVLIQPKVGHLHRFEFENVQEVVSCGEEEALKVLSSHAATRLLVEDRVVPGLACPVTPRDYVSVRLDSTACIGCGLCQTICETDAFWAGPDGQKATVRKLSNYECTRDHACARNCPTGAISLGNL